MTPDPLHPVTDSSAASRGAMCQPADPAQNDRRAPRDRPCKFDGEMVSYDPREDVWVRDQTSATGYSLLQYGTHRGACGRRLIMLRETVGRPPFRASVDAAPSARSEPAHVGPYVVIQQARVGQVERIIGPFVTHSTAVGWATDHQDVLGFYVVAPVVRPALAAPSRQEVPHA